MSSYTSVRIHSDVWCFAISDMYWCAAGEMRGLCLLYGVSVYYNIQYSSSTYIGSTCRQFQTMLTIAVSCQSLVCNFINITQKWCSTAHRHIHFVIWHWTTSISIDASPPPYKLFVFPYTCGLGFYHVPCLIVGVHIYFDFERSLKLQLRIIWYWFRDFRTRRPVWNVTIKLNPS